MVESSIPKIASFLKMIIYKRRYKKLLVAEKAKVKRVKSKEEAVLIIERSWIRFRQREEGLKIREYLRGVPYECRRSYVKYFDLKFKTIRLKTDVDKY